MTGAQSATTSPPTAAVDLFWLPLGAGGRVVAFNGRLYEALVAWRDRRPRLDLYHSALAVRIADDTYAIEMTPAWLDHPATRGVAVEGAVGARWAGRVRALRYEIRCWPGGEIGDVGCAVGPPLRLTDDPAVALRLLALVPQVPALTWGREQRGADMWNSNSVIAWLASRAGLPAASIQPPPGGRAPGWAAGLAVAGGSA